jgi:hypothetical protein
MYGNNFSRFIPLRLENSPSVNGQPASSTIGHLNIKRAKIAILWQGDMMTTTELLSIFFLSLINSIIIFELSELIRMNSFIIFSLGCWRITADLEYVESRKLKNRTFGFREDSSGTGSV